MEQQRIPCTILIKRRVSGDPGPPSSLQSGELAFNEPSPSLFIGTTQSELLSSENP
jgi:hypothetical protein